MTEALPEAPKPAVPLPASTTVIVRDGKSGLETFLTERPHTMAFAPGHHVFPGGRVDRADSDPALLGRLDGFDAGRGRFEADTGEIEPGAFWAGGFREMFEESGLLVATRHGEPLDGAKIAELDRRYRLEVQGGRLPFGELLETENLRLPAPRLLFLDHWCTPESQPRRFDTRFFLVVLTEPVDLTHTPGEALSAVWVQPGEALDSNQDGRIALLPPTMRTLRRLAGYRTVSELLEGYSSDEWAKDLARRRQLRQGPRIG